MDVNMSIHAGMYFSQEGTLGKLLTQVPKNINSKNNSMTEKLAEEGYWKASQKLGKAEGKMWWFVWLLSSEELCWFLKRYQVFPNPLMPNA